MILININMDIILILPAAFVTLSFEVLSGDNEENVEVTTVNVSYIIFYNSLLQ